MAAGRIVTIDADRLSDWAGFHDAFAAAFGFPGWYGRNLNAWIDLFTHMDEDGETTGFFVAPGGRGSGLPATLAKLRERAPR